MRITTGVKEAETGVNVMNVTGAVSMTGADMMKEDRARAFHKQVGL
jgi:hypothetical protein